MPEQVLAALQRDMRAAMMHDDMETVLYYCDAIEALRNEFPRLQPYIVAKRVAA